MDKRGLIFPNNQTPSYLSLRPHLDAMPYFTTLPYGLLPTSDPTRYANLVNMYNDLLSSQFIPQDANLSCPQLVSQYPPTTPLMQTIKQCMESGCSNQIINGCYPQCNRTWKNSIEAYPNIKHTL